MNILVFGKDGQLGKALKAVFDAKQLAGQHRIAYFGRAECDLANSEALTQQLNQMKPDLIINAAAYTAVDQAENEVNLAYAINAKAPQCMAIYAKRQGATFLHYSTDFVFDGSKKTPYIESDVRNPLGVYGKSKAAGEEAIENVFNSGQNSLAESNDTNFSDLKAQYAILRTSWVYGDGDNFIRTILRLAGERETLSVIADQHGVPTNATWLAEVSLALVFDEHDQLKPFSSGIYHAVPRGETAWHELACYAVRIALDAGAELMLRPARIEAIHAVNFPMIASRPMNSSLDVKKLQHVLLGRNDPSIAQLFEQSWNLQVAEYVNQFIKLKFDQLATIEQHSASITNYPK